MRSNDITPRLGGVGAGAGGCRCDEADLVGVELACVSAAECHLDMAAAVYHVRRADTLRHTMVGAEMMALVEASLCVCQSLNRGASFGSGAVFQKLFPLVRNSAPLLLAVLSRT